MDAYCYHVEGERGWVRTNILELAMALLSISATAVLYRLDGMYCRTHVWDAATKEWLHVR
jgi:hypothetical protein